MPKNNALSRTETNAAFSKVKGASAAAQWIIEQTAPNLPPEKIDKWACELEGMLDQLFPIWRARCGDWLSDPRSRRGLKVNALVESMTNLISAVMALRGTKKQTVEIPLENVPALNEELQKLQQSEARLLEQREDILRAIADAKKQQEVGGAIVPAEIIPPLPPDDDGDDNY